MIPKSLIIKTDINNHSLKPEGSQVCVEEVLLPPAPREGRPERSVTEGGGGVGVVVGVVVVVAQGTVSPGQQRQQQQSQHLAQLHRSASVSSPASSASPAVSPASCFLS